ncbi:MAG: hypothetical protein WAZ18_07400 [Alphaproteobacteria bacterium]
MATRASAKPAKASKTVKSSGVFKLNEKGDNVTSQHGEDGILAYLIQNLTGIPHTCCEFGAWDGKFMSNAYTLWHDKKWAALLIEADKERYDALVRDYSKKYKVTVLNAFITPQGDTCLDALAKKAGFATELGMLSIDIDSTDYHIWKSVKVLNPWIVVIEHNYTIPPWIDYNDPEGEVFMRASAKAMERLGREKGYKLVCCTLTNCIFVRADKFNPAVMPDLPVEALFDYSGMVNVVMHSALNDQNVRPVFFGANPKMRWLLRLYIVVQRLLGGGKWQRVSPAMKKALKAAGLSL